jgi:arylsulfatase A-like enzyme
LILTFALSLALLFACSSAENLPYRFDDQLGGAKMVSSEDPAAAGGFSFDFDDAGESLWKPLKGIESFDTVEGVLKLDVAQGAALESPEEVIFKAPEINEIELRMKTRLARHFAISWGNDPRRTTRIGIKSPGEFNTYVIDTSTLRRWNGRIDRVVLRPSDSREGDLVEIDYIKLKSEMPFSETPSGTGKHRIGDERRNVLFVHSPSRLVFEKRIGSDYMLDVGMGIAGTNSATEFTITVNQGGEESVVLSERISRADNWQDAGIDLSEWEGKVVDIVFRTESARRGGPALWSNPVLYKLDRERRNIVVYLIDALRSDHLSCYGYHRNTSPNIDDFAENGIICMNAYAHAARTVESIPTIMTSTYTSTHKIIDYTSQLSNDFVTMAEAMREAGYATASFITNPNAGEMTNVDQGFEFLIDKAPDQMFRSGLWTLPEEEVSSWLEAHRNRPFFIYVHTCEPHAPFEPPAPWNRHSDPEYAGSVTGFREGKYSYLEAVDPADVAHVIALYDGEVSLADHKFGEFLNILESKQLLEETMVFLIADHGEELMDHGDWNHSKTLYEEVLRVPMIVGGDDRLPSAQLEIPRTGLVDVMPTVLAWAGAPLPEDAEGSNIMDLIDQNDDANTRRIFAENYNPVYEAIALLRGTDKLIHNLSSRGEAELELYDLAADPAEKNNLSEESDLTGTLLEELLALKEEKESKSKGEVAEKELDVGSREKLRALGYID